MVRHILLVLIDCLRADHVSCYGYRHETTPTIDRLAKRGHLWEQAHSVCCWTRPSVATMLTGLYPTQHGAFEYIKRGNGATAATTDVLRSPRPTLAEILAGHGWRCGAFMRNEQLGEYTRLNRGFDAYWPDAGKSRDMVDGYRDWLLKRPGVPSLGYLHLMEAHWPYRARERHLRLYGGNREENCFREFTGVDFARLKRALSVGEALMPPLQLKQLVQMYDACVRRADEQLNEVLEMLAELGLRSDTAVIVTADHGEEFLDHGGIGHGQGLFQELIHVPLVMSVPWAAGPVRYPHPVSQVDLAATLLNLAGIKEDLGGRDLFTTPCVDRPLFAERRKRKRYSQIIRKGPWKFHRRYKFKIPSEEFDPSMTIPEMLDRFRHKVECELYNIADDPREQCDRVHDANCAAVRKQLERELDHWWKEVIASAQHDQTDQVEMDPRVVERLRDLGYLE